MSDKRWVENMIAEMLYERGQTYPRESYMLGAWLKGSKMYGLPERASSYRLSETIWREQGYRLYSADLFPHEEWNEQGLYSGIPFIQGHSNQTDIALLWISAAETWVDLKDEGDGKHVNYITESGSLEFIYISATSPKEIS